MRFSMLYSGEQILSFKSCLVFYAGDSLRFKSACLMLSENVMVERHNCFTLRGGGCGGGWGGRAPYVIFQQITHGNTGSES